MFFSSWRIGLEANIQIYMLQFKNPLSGWAQHQNEQKSVTIGDQKSLMSFWYELDASSASFQYKICLVFCTQWIVSHSRSSPISKIVFELITNNMVGWKACVKVGCIESKDSTVFFYMIQAYLALSKAVVKKSGYIINY